MIEIKPSHKNMLHSALGISPKKKIGVGTLMKTIKRAKSSGDTKLEKQAVFAKNAKDWN